MAVGNKRGGYPIDVLLQRLDALLGTQILQRIVIVGCGKIGTALMNYKGFANENVEVVAGFDNNPARINPAATPIPILPVSQLAAFVKEQDIQVAVLAVPENAAAGILDQLAADCAAEGTIDCLLVATPVPLTGSTGGIVAPTAIR